MEIDNLKMAFTQNLVRTKDAVLVCFRGVHKSWPLKIMHAVMSELNGSTRFTLVLMFAAF